MECPRKYQLGILEGWRQTTEKVNLEFGGYFAAAIEVYRKARLSGRTKEQGTIDALRFVIEASWLKASSRDEADGTRILTDAHPWGGRYESLWRCTGTEPYKNAKGNKAKCPYSHKGVWLPGIAPCECGSCGSKTETQRQWISDDKNKDRYTLVRLVAWYCDEQAENISEGVFPYSFPNGTPAVELSFKMPLPWQVHSGYKINPSDGVPVAQYHEQYLLCGHLDSIVSFGEEKFIDDNKTTTKALTANYFLQYSPNIQVDVYDLAGSMLYPSLAIKGVMIEGAQILQEGARFGIGIQYRTDALREELLQDIHYWLKQAERFAEDDYWPMNRASCYLCQFKQVCSKDPAMRQQYLEANFEKRHWNPLEER